MSEPQAKPSLPRPPIVRIFSRISRGFLLFGLAPLISFSVSCTDKSESKPPQNELQKQLNTQPRFDKECKQLEASYRQLCDQQPTGETCVLKTKEALDQAMAMTEKLPHLDEKHQALMELFLQQTEVTSSDIRGYFSHVGRECWRLTELYLWQAIFNNVDRHPAAIEQVRHLLTKRLFDRARSSTTLLGMHIEVSTLRAALEAKLIKVDELAAHQLEALKDELKSKSQPLTKKFTKAIRGEKAQGARDQTDESSMKIADPETTFSLLKEEYAIVKHYRNDLAKWVSENLK